MAALANLAGGLLVQESQAGLAIGSVALVAVDAAGRAGVTRLPLGQEYVEVVVEILALGHRSMTFQAVGIRDRAGQRGGLFVIMGDEGQQVAAT